MKEKQIQDLAMSKEKMTESYQNYKAEKETTIFELSKKLE